MNVLSDDEVWRTLADLAAGDPDVWQHLTKIAAQGGLTARGVREDSLTEHSGEVPGTETPRSPLSASTPPTTDQPPQPDTETGSVPEPQPQGRENA